MIMILFQSLYSFYNLKSSFYYMVLQSSCILICIINIDILDLIIDIEKEISYQILPISCVTTSILFSHHQV